MPISDSPYPSAYDTVKADEIWALLGFTDQNFVTEKNIHQKIQAVFGNSPYLAALACRFPKETNIYLQGNLEKHAKHLFQTMSVPRPDMETTSNLMAFLRDCKSKISLICAIADVTNEWPLEKITETLSLLAELSLEIGLAHLLHIQMQKGELAWPDKAPEPVSLILSRKCGYFILGMGKLGAYELNYSSDIDLIVLFDPDKTQYIGKRSEAQCFIKITQELMQIIEKRTMHGYVFRTDLRLRPDPSSTPVAISVYTAESYYHSMAANWERSAMIKARVVAGDKETGAEYLSHLSNWIWRRSMDFAALKDIAGIKDQIDRHYQQTNLAPGPGFNVKLGTGGIREIEFFTQINQLLHAGRHPDLRIKGTLQALGLLAEQKFITPSTQAQLQSAYVFLRTLEHRIQMINDEQSHDIPEENSQLDRLVSFMGFPSQNAMFAEVSIHATAVSNIYASLLPGDSYETTASLSEAEIERELTDLSYENPTNNLAIIKQWRQGKYQALRTDRARKLLDQCLPQLLTAFSKTDAPAAALLRFDKFIGKLPTGVQLFSLLQSNPSLFKLLARVMGLAPALADTLSKKPTLWDMVLEPHFFEPIENETALVADLQNRLTSAQDFQDVLDFVRIFVAEQKFRAGIHLLESIASVEEVGSALSRIADVTLKILIPAVETEFRRRHGEFPGGGIAVLAMGKYGGMELTHTSDLDIVFLYHIEGSCKASNGEKPLSPSQYFSRLGQNIITAITALTSEGRLFEVDTRLRPSGSQGPLVVTLETFQDYYATRAWTWEHMALTRARLIVAPKAMITPLEKSIDCVLTGEREHDNLLMSVHDMHTKLYQQFGSENKWSVKHCRGGLVDMEFICQYLMLLSGNEYHTIFTPKLSEAIEKLQGIGHFNKETAINLHCAHEFMQQIQSLIRLCLSKAPATSGDIPEGLKQTLLQATNLNSFADLESTLEKHQLFIYKLYEKLIETPAVNLDKNKG